MATALHALSGKCMAGEAHQCRAYQGAILMQLSLTVTTQQSLTVSWCQNQLDATYVVAFFQVFVPTLLLQIRGASRAHVISGCHA